ncbi:histidine kinase [Lachnospiraceae bacterium]|nr:histidine kinase [Lachnospiraceae bacterium]
MENIKVRLLGNPELRVNGTLLSFPYKKAEGFFYYLCVKKSVTREEVISLLWADEDESAGKKKLRDAVYQVRQLLGKEVLLTSGHTGIALNPEGGLAIDLDRDERRHSGEKIFLDHFYIKNCYEFEQWAEEVRNSIRHEMTARARKMLEEAARSHDTEEMQHCGNLLIEDDPYNEAIYYELMNLYAGNGSYHMAIRLYYDLEKRLKEDTGEEPAEKTKELFHRIFGMKEHVPAAGTVIADTPFIGREQELFTISEMLNREDGDKMNLALAEAEEGVGKTAFLACCRRLAKGMKMLTLGAVCYRQGADFFLSPWNDIVRDIQQRVEEGTLTGDFSGEIGALLRWDEGREPGGESGYLRYQSIEQNMLNLFRKISGDFRIFLSFDEIQWMDPISFRLLNRLLNALSPDRCKVLCSYQTSFGSGVLHQLEMLVREDRIHLISLHPFRESETRRFVLQALPELCNHEDQLAQIYQMTEGNAFFLKEIIALIREKGFTLEKTPKINLFISSRLSGLGEKEMEILGCMSVFPEKISIEELEFLLRKPDRLKLIRALDQLQSANLVQEVPVGWAVYYKFAHRIFQEYVYEHQSAGKRQLYHRMLSQYYERENGDRFASLPILAYHCMRANEEVRAYRYQIRYLKEFYTIINENFPILHREVSDPEDSIGVMAEAEKMLGLAQNVIRLKDKSKEVAEMKMQMYYILGRHDIAEGEYDRGIANIEQSLKLARELNAHKDILACYRQHIFHGIQTGDVKLVEQYVSMAFELIDRSEPDEYATFLRLRAWHLIRRGDYAVAQETLFRAVELFSSLTAESGKNLYKAGMAACYAYLGDIYRFQEDPGEALRYYHEGVRIGQGAVVTNGMAQLYASIGQVKFHQGRYTESGIYLDKARECLEKNSYRWGLERAEAYLALLRLEEGEPDEARIHYEKGRALSRKIRNPETEALLEAVEQRMNLSKHSDAEVDW